MVKAYSYVEGIEEVLHGLKQNNYEIHAFTNYPVWLVVNFLISFFFYSIKPSRSLMFTPLNM